MLDIKKHKNKCILYGTGNAARDFCRNNISYDIVGCLDGYKVCGYFEGIRIITWDDIAEGLADVVVIAAGRKNLRTVYERIRYRCDYFRLDVYDVYGNNLNDIYHDFYISKDDIAYFGKSYDDLLHEIDRADCVSFDLFDTLIMRKTLYREDIFYLTDIKIRKKGIEINDFVKKRISAEQEVREPSFDEIYSIIQKECRLTEEEAAFIQETEYRIESENIVCRESMAEALEHAVRQGKRVNIISDMYYSEQQLRTLSERAGVQGFEKIFVSGDYKVAKSTNLFEVYRSSVKGERYLHVGDNINADVRAAEKAGIETFHIKSGVDLLKMSSIRGCLRYEPETGCRMYMGLLVADLFNDPFCLAGTSGVVRDNDYKHLIKNFLSPTALSYAQYIRECFDDRYAGILFVARDGWLFKEIFDEMTEEDVPTWYFLSSRKAAYSVLNPSAVNKEKLGRHLRKREYADADAMAESLSPSSEKEYEKNISAITNYIKKIGVDCTDRYLFCDLASAGSTQYALNHDLFKNSLDGVYFYRGQGEWEDESENRSMMSEGQWRLISYSNPLLEMIFTSLEPSVEGYTEGGNVIYQDEKRTMGEIELLGLIHDGIRVRCRDFIETGNYSLPVDFSILMIRLMYEAVLNGKLDGKENGLVLSDDLDGSNIFMRFEYAK